MLCLSAKLNGMPRAVVVAGKAGEACAVVLPLRLQAFASVYIVCGAYLCANAALDAPLAFYPERLVGDEVPDKDAADEPRIDARPATNGRWGGGRLSVYDALCYGLQLYLGILFFLAFVCRCVNIHEG